MGMILVCCPSLDRRRLDTVLAGHGLRPRRPGAAGRPVPGTSMGQPRPGWWTLARTPTLPARAVPGSHRVLLGAAQDRAGQLVCIGGPLGALDLDRTRNAARRAAQRVWRIWDAVVFDTPPAQPSSVFWARHRADPAAWPVERVDRAFAAQPRVRALRDYDWRPDTQPLFCRFRPDSYATAVEELQTGRAAFVGYHQQQAVLGEALVGCDGQWLAPAGPGFGDRAAYAQAATDYLAGLPADTMLVTVHATAGPTRRR